MYSFRTYYHGHGAKTCLSLDTNLNYARLAKHIVGLEKKGLVESTIYKSKINVGLTAKGRVFASTLSIGLYQNSSQYRQTCRDPDTNVNKTNTNDSTNKRTGSTITLLFYYYQIKIKNLKGVCSYSIDYLSILYLIIFTRSLILVPTISSETVRHAYNIENYDLFESVLL